MRQSDYIIFKGVHSRAMGVRMTEIPFKAKPPLRKTDYTVPGRHGTLQVTESDRPVYDVYSDNMSGVLLPHADWDRVKAWLSGTGELTTSREPGRRQTICPDSREKSLALTKLEETVMWANAAIARNE